MNRPLDYRHPATPEAAASVSVQEAILHRERGALRGIIIRWVAGCIGLVFVCGVGSLAILSYLLPRSPGVAVWGFASAGVVVAYLCFRADRIIMNSDYPELTPDNWSPDGWSSDTNLPPTVWSGIGQRRSSTSAYVEIAAWGPQQMRMAREKYESLQKLDGVNRRRAAEVLSAMLAVKRDMPFGELVAVNETPQQLLDTLAYLNTHDWIGINLNRRIAWVRTQVRPGLSGA